MLPCSCKTAFIPITLTITFVCEPYNSLSEVWHSCDSRLLQLLFIDRVLHGLVCLALDTLATCASSRYLGVNHDEAGEAAMVFFMLLSHVCAFQLAVAPRIGLLLHVNAGLGRTPWIPEAAVKLMWGGSALPMIVLLPLYVLSVLCWRWFDAYAKKVAQTYSYHYALCLTLCMYGFLRTTHTPCCHPSSHMSFIHHSQDTCTGLFVRCPVGFLQRACWDFHHAMCSRRHE